MISHWDEVDGVRRAKGPMAGTWQPLGGAAGSKTIGVNRIGDTIVHLADHEEHTLRAGPDGLEVIAFGTRHPVEYGWLPRSKAMRFGYVWTEGRVDDPWDVEDQVGELEFSEPGERPTNVVALEDVELDEDGDKMVA